MSGEINLIGALIITLSLLAASTDVIKGKIYNWSTLPAMLLGLGLATIEEGWAGLGLSLLGLTLGLVAYGWMYALGVMGAGDVKFLMALGALGGVRFGAEVALMGVLLAGVMAIAVLFWRGALVGFTRKIYRFLRSVFIRELELEVPKIDRKSTLPFGVPLATAAIWGVLGAPLKILGITLW